MATYTAIDAQTVAQIAAQSPTYAKQILWMADIHFDRAGYNPFADLMGGIDSVKPIKEILDTTKVRGNTIVITQEAGLGGKGVQGATALIGSEEKRKYSQYTLTIGMHRHAVGETVTTKDQTFIGTTFDNSARRSLNEWVQRLKCDCIEATMIGEATSRNILYAGNKTSIDTLTSTDVVTKSTISQAKIMANGLGMKPIAIAKDKGNQRILKYYFQGNDYLFQGLRENSTWESLLATAGERGPNNYLFGGHLPEYDGVMLNNWAIASNSADAAQGAFCAPRAYLGVAIVAKGTSTTLTALSGGGYNNDSTLTTNAVAKTGNDYFRYFPNAPFSAFEKTFIQADTSTNRYLMVVHASGADVGKYSFFRYTTTDGYTISATDLERLGSTSSGDYVTTLTGSSITWGTAPWLSTYLSEGIIPIGSLIIPVNAKGQPYVSGYLMGNDAIITGYGTIDRKPSTAMGQRVTEVQDYQNNYGIGVRMVWGCAAIQNAAKIVAGYIVVYGAYNLPGMPEVS
jgi:hypothetical protein